MTGGEVQEVDPLHRVREELHHAQQCSPTDKVEMRHHLCRAEHLVYRINVRTSKVSRLEILIVATLSACDNPQLMSDRLDEAVQFAEAL